MSQTVMSSDRVVSGRPLKLIVSALATTQRLVHHESVDGTFVDELTGMQYDLVQEADDSYALVSEGGRRYVLPLDGKPGRMAVSLTSQALLLAWLDENVLL